MTYSKIEHLFWLTRRSFDALGLSQLWMVRLHHILAESVLVWGRVDSHSLCSSWVWRPAQPTCLASIWIHTAIAGDVWNIRSALLNLRRAWQTSAVLSMDKFLLALWSLAAGGMLVAKTLAILLLRRCSSPHLLLRKVASELIVTGQLLLLLQLVRLFLIAIAIIWHAEVPIFIFAKRCHVCTLSIIIHLTGVSRRRWTVAHWLVAVICLESLSLIVITTIRSTCLLFVRPHVFLRGRLLLSLCRICSCCNALLAAWCFHRRCIMINWRVLLGLSPYAPACYTSLDLLLLGFR